MQTITRKPKTRKAPMNPAEFSEYLWQQHVERDNRARASFMDYGLVFVGADRRKATHWGLMTPGGTVIVRDARLRWVIAGTQTPYGDQARCDNWNGRLEAMGKPGYLTTKHHRIFSLLWNDFDPTGEGE